MKNRNSKIEIGIAGLLCGTIVFSSGFTILNLKLLHENKTQKIETQNVERTLIIKDEFLVAKNVYEMQKYGSTLMSEKEIWFPFFELTNAERDAVRYIVAGEAGYETLDGKMAVAQCILNAMAKENKRPEEIRKLYKYAGWKTNLEFENLEMWEEVCEAVDRVFDDGEFVSENPILFFYAPKYSSGRFHNTLPKDKMIGGHSFHYIEEDKTAEWFTDLKMKNSGGVLYD